MRYRNYLYLLCLSASYVSASEVLEEIKVVAHPLAKDGVAQSTIVISGEALSQKLQGSIGETISGEVGVRSASFGTAVGRPVIHGLGGARVKTTEDRIDSLDVSVTSTDHAVTVEPFIADRINIIKGASTLLYGSGAIGGVVDVETGRIARELPEDLGGKLEIRAGENGESTVAAARLDGAVGDVAWHIDAFDRDSNDYDIPGFAESEAFRAAEEAEAGHEHEEEEGEEAQGTLPGSFNNTHGGAIGLSWIGDRGFVGLSVSTTDSEYGLVGGHGHEEEEGHGHDEDEHEHEEGGHEEDEHEGEHEGELGAEEEAPGMVDLEQTRIDFEAQLESPYAGIRSVNFRIGINDYEHDEIEGSGEIGTRFDNEAWEARLQFDHEAIAGFVGSFGIQLSDREFSAIGEEAFVPPTDSDSLGLFWLGEKEFSSFDLELGARIDDVSYDVASLGINGLDFTTESFSIGALSSREEGFNWSALLNYSSRAPMIEELFSNGPHLATQSFEIGDRDLEEESVLAFSISSTYKNDWLDLMVTAYVNEFSDFIYQQATGEEEDELPVFQYRQQDARFVGLDVLLRAHLGVWYGGDFDVEINADTVDARLDSGANRDLPRIPASRFGVTTAWKSSSWHARFSYTRVDSQRDVAPFELPTDGYDDLSLYLAHTLGNEDHNVTIFVQGKNLTDEEQRHHVSFVKDLAPAPGRRWELGLRWQF